MIIGNSALKREDSNDYHQHQDPRSHDHPSDQDLGVAPANQAQQIADEEGQAVTLRDPTTDKVLGKVKPAKKAAPPAKRTKAAAKAPKAKKADTARAGKTQAAPKPKAPKG